MSLDQMRRYTLRSVALLAMTAVILFASGLTASAAISKLPPRPTPVVSATPAPTSTPAPTPLPPRPVSRAQPEPPAEPISHIVLVTASVVDGLWTVVQWQGQDGVWHEVTGWQGTLVAGSKRWAVLERNFGEGPFRWVVYDMPDGNVRGMSQVFSLPATRDEQLSIRIMLAP